MVKFKILVALLCLLAVGSCNEQEPRQQTKDNEQKQEIPENGVPDNAEESDELESEDRSASLGDVIPEVQVYSETELETFEKLLSGQPAEIRKKLQDDGAILTSDYLIEYISKGRMNMVVRMIASGMDLNNPGGNGKRPLAQAILRNDPYLIDLMIDRGADPLLPDDPANGVSRSMLHYAAKLNNAELVQRLIDMGIDPDVEDLLGKTPVEVNAYYGGKESMRTLIENGADPERSDAEGSRPILMAAGFGRLAIVKLLTEYGVDINYQHDRGWTPLLLAIFYNHEETVDYLLEQGADISAKNRTGHGAVALAMTVHNPDLLRRLIDSGAPLDTLTKDEGHNLIHLCVSFQLHEFIQELAQMGVDPALEDANGKTPLDLSRELDYPEAENILMELTGEPPLAPEETGNHVGNEDSQTDGDAARSEEEPHGAT